MMLSLHLRCSALIGRMAWLAMFLLCSMVGWGQIAAWDLTGEGSTTNATSTADVYSSAMDASNLLTRGAGAAYSSGGNSFRTQGFQNNGISTANTDYFQFTLSAAPGYTLSLSTIDARFAGTSTFAASPGVTHQFAYSLDGTTFTLIGSTQATIGSPATLSQISLTGIPSLQSVSATTTVTFRYYASGQTTTGGWGFNSPSAGAYGLAIGGSLVPLTPSITSITPSSATAGGAGFTLTVDGTNFISGVSTVQWNGSSRTTTFVSATQVTASIPNTDIASAGSATVTVLNTGNPTASNSLLFTINPSTGPDCLGVNGGTALPGTGCNDNDACTIDDIWSPTCVCTGTFQDSDSDGTCDANDGCPNDGTKTTPGTCGCGNPEPSASCNDNNACTINDVVNSSCVCAGTFQDTDVDGVCDASDNCPTVTGQVGSFCDDGNACTINDVLNASCVCVGTAPSALWNFTTTSANSALSNVTVSVIGRGNNNGTTTLLTSTSASSTSDYATASAGNNAGAASFTGALNTATSTYFEFTLTPSAGSYFTLSAISFGSRSTSTGPQAYSLRSSADNYASNIATGTLSNGGLWQFKSNTGLSAATYGGAPLTFRLYGHGGTGTPSANTANWRIDDLSINGCPTTCSNPTVDAIIGASSICVGGSTTYTDNTPGGVWSVVNGTGTATIDQNGVLSATGAGTVTVEYAVTNICGVTTVQLPVTINANTCAPGTYLNVSTCNCDVAPPGYYAPGGGTQAFPCAPGSFASGSGQSSCAFCPPGYFSDTFASVLCSACGSGTYNPSEGATECLSCDGTTNAPVAATSCTPLDSDGDGIPDSTDPCPFLPNLSNGQSCDDGNACTISDVVAGCVCAGIYQDSDADGTCDANDGCPNDPNKVAPGICGCGVADTDTDSDGTADCNDGCPNDANKTSPGQCGCGVADTDTDSDGTADCNDGCPNDPNKIAPGACGCGVADVLATYYADVDGDGFGDPNNSQVAYTCNPPSGFVTNSNDNCPGTSNPTQEDWDADGHGDVCDNCPFDTNVDQADADGDGYGDLCDGCPNDPNKVAPGICGCGVPDTDGDGDGTADCNDGCPNDPNKTGPGACGCGVADTDGDSDGTPDCNDGCPTDPNKVSPGTCGCGAPELGATCDDGNVQTINDVIQADCSCSGTLVDCSDGDPCTADAYNGSICVHTPLPDTDSDGTCDVIDGCPNDADKIAPGQCGCGVSDLDTDADGTADCNDACADDPDKVAPGICGCSTPDDDTDIDGLADCVDPCPESMDNLDSDSDGTYDCYDLCPNDPNKVNPGACGCGSADADSDNDTYMDCVDGCPNDPGKIAPGICGCGVAEVDTDGDGTYDCLDGCPTDPNKIGPGICGCGVADTDSDGDGTADCNDSCPTLFGAIGSNCDDGDANTTNDVVTSGCQCVGTPIITCTQNAVDLEITTDANSQQTMYDIVFSGTNTAVCSGGGLPSSSTITLSCCLPDGCYDLRVFDSFGDGINPGGYVLRDANNKVIIDNGGNGAGFTTLSMVRDANNAPQSFCLPLGADALTSATCGLMTASLGTVLQAVPNPAVTTGYGTMNSTTGYQFWFFNPNGGYSRRIFQSHSAPGSGYPAGTAVALRSSYLKLSAIVTNPLPQNVLLNVRVRSQVAGVYTGFGPACRLMLAAPTCQTTQLTTTADPAISCGASVNRSGGVLHANAVAGATKYQFNFSRPGYARNIASSTRSLTLGVWATNPLQCGLTYDVKVRASLDGGATYCPYGAICQVTITCSSSFVGGTRDLAVEEENGHTPVQLVVWPNPNNGDVLHVSMEGIDPTIGTAVVDITDLFGRRVYTRTIAVEGRLNQPIELNNTLAKGVYILSVITGERMSTERIVIQ